MEPGPLPSGAVTFVFTDIEGSTARWERDRAAMQHAVRRHDAVVRSALNEHRGHVFKTIGDAFCCAFAEPESALAATLAIQRALAAEDFSAVDGLRVRAAVHTGTADERDGDYFGPALNKVARLLAIGHGGQILVSSETHALVAEGLPVDLSLRDLGTYRVKDIAEPQRVYQVVAAGIAATFPPLRSLGTLPSDSSIVDTAAFHAVPGFSGRGEQLAAVHAALAQDGGIAVVHGLGGVGKSSIAREYGWRHRGDYSIVWWLNAQTEDGIVDSLLRLGAMFVHGLDQLPDRRAGALRVVNSMLGGFDKPVLLVFDNLEDERLLHAWLPRTARALVTSRDAAWSSDRAIVPVDMWPLDTAVAYLKRESGREDLTDADAGAIADALGGLPLAMAHAAAALRGMRMIAPQRYLEHINEHLKNAPRGSDYPRSVAATFRASIVQAEQQAPGAAAVLCFAARFAPDALPEELLHPSADLVPDGLEPALPGGGAVDLRSAVAGELGLDVALAALDRLGLLAFAASSRTYVMHRLVLLAGRDLVDDAAAWSAHAVAAANATFPRVTFAAWPLCARLLPHALAALESDAAEQVTAAALTQRCASYLLARGEYAGAERLGARALDSRRNALGPRHPDVAVSLNTLANVYAKQGRFAEAQALFADVVAIREEALGPEHLDVAVGLGNLAVVHIERGQFADAEALHRRALDIRERALGPRDPLVARSVLNLGILYRDEGRYAEAEPLLTRALAILEDVLAPGDPEIAVSMTYLAYVYGDVGREREAEALHVRALAIREQALGPEHPDVWESLNGLGMSYYNQGRYPEAEALYQRGLTIQEHALGPEHPRVAHSLSNLANVYGRCGRQGEAESLHLRALTMREATLGADHPDVALSLNDLAALYGRQGRHDEAQAMIARAASIFEKALGPDHPSTRATREALNAGPARREPLRR